MRICVYGLHHPTYGRDRSSGGGVINTNIFPKMHLLFRKSYDHQTNLKQDKLSVWGSETGRQTFVTTTGGVSVEEQY